MFCGVALVGSLGVGSSFPDPMFASRCYHGILCPVSTLALLPFVLSFIQIWEPDLQLVWVRGWFMLSEGSEGLRSQFLVCKINWAELNEVLWDDFGEPYIGHRDTLQQRGLVLPVLPVLPAGRRPLWCRDGAVGMGGRTAKNSISLGLALPAPTSCDGDKCSEVHIPSPFEVNAMFYTRIWVWVFQKQTGFAFILKLNYLLLSYVIAA